MSDDDHVIPVILAIFERYKGTKTHLNIAFTPPPLSLLLFFLLLPFRSFRSKFIC